MLSKLMAPFIAAMVVAGLAPHAHALATADATATATLTFVELRDEATGAVLSAVPADLIVAGDSFPFFTFLDDFGTGVASLGGSFVSPLAVPPPALPSPLPIGGSIIVLSETSATADFPFGGAAAAFDADMLVDIVHEGLFGAAPTYELDFLFEYEISGSAAVTDPFFELAIAFAEILLDEDSGQLGSIVDVFGEMDTDFGDPLFASGLVSVPFTLIIEPGDEVFIEALISSDVLAISESPAVPEPVTAVLGLMGLGGVGLTVKRRCVV